MKGRGKRGPVIAVDGPGGAGKSTVSRLLAERLGFRYIDTGAMYRALALRAHESGVDVDDEASLGLFLKYLDLVYDVESGRIFLNNSDYTERIREPHVGELASRASRKGLVRRFLVDIQRRLGERGGVVMEGRDIGTVVFPHADVKFFLFASDDVRARRRHREFALRYGSTRVGIEEVKGGLKDRDRRDSEREDSPLRKADDAIFIDTSSLGLEEVVERVLDSVRKRLGS